MAISIPTSRRSGFRGHADHLFRADGDQIGAKRRFGCGDAIQLGGNGEEPLVQAPQHTLGFLIAPVGGSLRDCGLNSPASNNRRPLLDGRIQEFAKPGLCNLHLPRTYGEPPFICQHLILQTSHMTS
jgi:hypothetical protein